MRGLPAIPLYLCVCGLLAAACGTANAQTTPKTTQPAPARSQAAAPRTTVRKAQPAKSDTQIEAALKAKLAKSPKLSTEHYQVHVQGGVATIEGKTDVIQHKGTATRMAKSAGAVAVNNHIQVSEAAKEKAAGNLETGRRRAQIKRGDPRSETQTSKGQSR